MSGAESERPVARFQFPPELTAPFRYPCDARHGRTRTRIQYSGLLKQFPARRTW